jgi:hypothetical protein
MRSIRAPSTIRRPRRSAKKGYGPFGYRFKRIARLAGARSDCEKVKNGGCKLRQNRRIGSARQLALVSGELEAIFECAVEAAKAPSLSVTRSSGSATASVTAVPIIKQPRALVPPEK